MNLHEYQAKDLLRKYNLPILEGKSYVGNVDNLGRDLQNIKGPPWVITVSYTHLTLPTILLV